MVLGRNLGIGTVPALVAAHLAQHAYPTGGSAPILQPAKRVSARWYLWHSAGCGRLAAGHGGERAQHLSIDSGLEQAWPNTTKPRHNNAKTELASGVNREYFRTLLESDPCDECSKLKRQGWYRDVPG